MEIPSALDLATTPGVQAQLPPPGHDPGPLIHQVRSNRHHRDQIFGERGVVAKKCEKNRHQAALTADNSPDLRKTTHRQSDRALFAVADSARGAQ